MKILILGGTGFIGSHVTDMLRVSGHEVTVYRDDIADMSALTKHLPGKDMVIHCVSTMPPPECNRFPKRNICSDLLNTIDLLDYMVKYNVPKIMYFSSGGAVYGNANVTSIPETHPCNPISSYGIVKKSIEDYIRIYHNNHGLEYIILRPSNVYGNGARYGLIKTICDKIESGEIIEIRGDGNSTRDYIHVSDVGRACVSLIEKQFTGIFNVGYGQGSSINTLLHDMQLLSGGSLTVKNVNSDPNEVIHSCLDTTVLESTGWRPYVNLSSGLRYTLG